MTLPFPYLITYIALSMNVTQEGMEFKDIPYNIVQRDKTLKPVSDHNVRKSQIYQIPIPTLTEASEPIINQYFLSNNLKVQYAHASSEWRILRYNQTGHFKEHKDRQRKIDGYIHFGTQIFLPPKDSLQYEGGQLIMWYKDQQKKIEAHPTQWTHIIMPLGILHKVTEITKGVRLSYVKSIYVVRKKRQTLKPKQPQNKQL